MLYSYFFNSTLEDDSNILFPSISHTSISLLIPCWSSYFYFTKKMHTFWKEFLHNPTPTLTNPSTMVTLSSGFTLVRMTDTFLSGKLLAMCSRFHLLWSTPGSGWCNYPNSRLHLQFSLFETFCNNIQFPKSLLSI